MIILADFISGVSVGIEFFFGEALEPDDKFAMQIDVLIFRLTFIWQ